MKDFNDQIWGYLHDELPPEKRKHFEQALADDPRLRETVGKYRPTHQALELLGDRQLEERLLAEWESEHPEHREPRQRARSRIIRFGLPLAAAAAAMFLLLALPRNQDPVHWQKTVYGSAPQLRGQTGGNPHYGRTALKRVNEELREAIETSLASRLAPSAPWTFKIQLQELANGFLALEISGYPDKAPEQSAVWNKTFQGPEQVGAEAPALGKKIAEDILERKDR